VTLDFAGNILMPDEGGFSPQPTNPKSKHSGLERVSTQGGKDDIQMWMSRMSGHVHNADSAPAHRFLKAMKAY
jgi:hypothetical protein